MSQKLSPKVEDGVLLAQHCICLHKRQHWWLSPINQVTFWGNSVNDRYQFGYWYGRDTISTCSIVITVFRGWKELPVKQFHSHLHVTGETALLYLILQMWAHALYAYRGLQMMHSFDSCEYVMSSCQLCALTLWMSICSSASLKQSNNNNNDMVQLRSRMGHWHLLTMFRSVSVS